MDANDLILKDEVYRIVGAAFAVLRDVGHGLHGKPYENALTVEFAFQRIACAQQQRFPILYRNTQVGEYVPDLIVFGAIIVDTKVIDRITDHERGQMMNSCESHGLKSALFSTSSVRSLNGSA